MGKTTKKYKKSKFLSDIISKKTSVLHIKNVGNIDLKYVGYRKFYVDDKEKKGHVIFARDRKNNSAFVFFETNDDLSVIKSIFICPTSPKLYDKLSERNLTYFELNNLSGDELDRIINTLSEVGLPNDLLSESKYKEKLEVLTFIVTTVLGIFSLIIWLYFLGKVYRIYKAETEADRISKELIKKMFGNQKKSYEFFSEYSDLIYGIKNMLSSKTINGLLIYGKPGTGKTFMTLRTLYFENKKFILERGGVKTLFEFGKILYKYRHGYVIILDDFDSALNDPDMINVLKSAADTYTKRIISLPFADKSDSTAITLKPIPEKFVFTSKIVIITNKKKHEIPKALISRMVGIDITFSNDAMIKIFEKYIDILSNDLSKKDKLEIIEFIKKIKDECGVTVDFRLFNTLSELKRIYKDEWKKYARELYCNRRG